MWPAIFAQPTEVCRFRFCQGFVDTARLKSALSEARSEAETCLAGLDAGVSDEVDELRKQLQQAQEAASSCLLQMNTAAPSDEARFSSFNVNTKRLSRRRKTDGCQILLCHARHHEC